MKINLKFSVLSFLLIFIFTKCGSKKPKRQPVSEKYITASDENIKNIKEALKILNKFIIKFNNIKVSYNGPLEEYIKNRVQNELIDYRSSELKKVKNSYKKYIKTNGHTIIVIVKFKETIDGIEEAISHKTIKINGREVTNTDINEFKKLSNKIEALVNNCT